MRKNQLQQEPKGILYLAEAADNLDFSVSEKENISDVLDLLGVSGGLWLWISLDEHTNSHKIQREILKIKNITDSRMQDVFM
jgi:hypothetical protein